MNKGFFLLHGFLFVLLILIQSTDATNWLKACFGGSCFPKEDKYDRYDAPVKQRPNAEYVPPSKPAQEIKKQEPVIAKPEPVVVTPATGNKPTRRSSIKKTENGSPPKSRRQSSKSNGSPTGDGSTTGKTKSTLKKREAARSENILADIEVQVGSGGKSRTMKQAGSFKVAVEEKCKAKGLSDTFVITGESCANGMGNLYKKLLSNKKVIYEVCFDDLTSTAIYTTHTSKPFEEKATKTDRKAMDTKWKTSYLLSLWNVDSYYTKKAQKAEFDRIYGDNQDYVAIDGSNWYAHAHLTPHGDFIEEEEQLATYEHHNCVPGKQSVNNGNWKRIENYGRGLIKDYNSNILVYTGVHEQLELKVKSTGKLAKAWLNEEDHRLAVPKIHFKLYINPANNQSVAFFTSNDTNMDEDGKKKFLSMCDNKCNDINFDSKDDVERGITICCTYRQFSNHIKFLPKMLPIGSELFKRTTRDTSPKKSRSRSSSPPAKR